MPFSNKLHNKIILDTIINASSDVSAYDKQLTSYWKRHIPRDTYLLSALVCGLHVMEL
jgi:tellurite resistance protein